MDRIDEFFGTAFKKYIVYVGYGIEMLIASFIMLGAALLAAITIPFVLLGWLGKSLGIFGSKKPRGRPIGLSHTKETKKKMSDAAKEMWKRRRGK